MTDDGEVLPPHRPAVGAGVGVGVGVCVGVRVGGIRPVCPPRVSITVAVAEEDEVLPSDESALARPPNVYFETLQNISAPEIVSGFAETAPPEVQQAVRATVMSLLGNLPPQMYETSVVSTGQNVASLMYSMQMTGYMFRNAEYRRSLMESLDSGSASPMLPSVDEAGADLPPVSGKIKVKLSQDVETEVDASAYMAELRSEVMQLRSELLRAKENSREAQGGGLLSYIQSLPRDSIKSLTSSVSEEVLAAMRLLIEDILKEAEVGGDTFMETSGLKLRELLAWQLIAGYRLRELEQKEELRKLL